MFTAGISERINKSGLTYVKFLELTQKKLGDNEFKKNDKYDITKLNLQRSNRIYKTYTVSEQMKDLMSSINKPQTWVVVTEDWCGDSAQNLPYIVKIAELNPLITMKIILRDQNLDIMDMYLTNGKSRSIPKLVVFEQYDNELFQWGPRPKEAQMIVDKSIKDGLGKNSYLEKLHSWYSEDKGQTLEKEFLIILQNLL